MDLSTPSFALPRTKPLIACEETAAKVLVGLPCSPGWTWATAQCGSAARTHTDHTRAACSQPPPLPGGPEGKFPLGKVNGQHPAKGTSSNFVTGPSAHAQGDQAARDVSPTPCPNPSPGHRRQLFLQSRSFLPVRPVRSGIRSLCHSRERARIHKNLCPHGGTEREM